ncbi:unnamed protein product [Prorocentrum cordatum]|uniref:Transmembrane protein n=1 Tax=Prorocentrum cordatum TaxID=2364126 RepID=A0ABN9Q576_9DINO|nr:unnamed protein product [Polarella glacialis]
MYMDVSTWVGFVSTSAARARLAEGSRLRLARRCEATCWYAVHVAVLALMVLAADGWGRFHLVQVVTIIPRLAINMIYFRKWVTSCCTLLHSFLQVVVLLGADVHFRQPESESIRLYVSIEIIIAVFLVAGIAAWESFVRTQILAEIERATTQSEATASRRLLNTICDATFELDGDLLLTGEAAQLAGMLHLGPSRCSRGAALESFVLPDSGDRECLRERITAPVPDNQDRMEMANVFHVCLCDSLSNSVKVEVYHVPVHCPSAAEHHLVGLKELVDFRDTIDRELPAVLTGPQLGQVSSRRSKRSRRRGSRRGSTLASLSGLGTPPDAAASAGLFADLRQDYTPLAVKFDADSMTVLDATGDGAEACVQGSCFRSMLLPGQDFFMDIQMGCHALREMLVSDPYAQFHFRTCVEFSQGVVQSALCEVVLMVVGAARTDSECTQTLPIVATLQVVGSMPRTPTSSQSSDVDV